MNIIRNSIPSDLRNRKYKLTREPSLKPVSYQDVRQRFLRRAFILSKITNSFGQTPQFLKLNFRNRIKSCKIKKFYYFIWYFIFRFHKIEEDRRVRKILFYLKISISCWNLNKKFVYASSLKHIWNLKAINTSFKIALP